ncbi:MAG TPA: ABC transporter permease, partial [Candidatus Saccharimonadales bacterium]|nr:ABC transporter permease [Candidatus Saccharimonadales bacterium]
MKALYILIAVFILARISRRLQRRRPATSAKPAKTRRPESLSPWQRKLFTVYIFSKLNTRRFFRDRLALFFGILFPLIFLFVFGSISKGGGGHVSFKVALINNSPSQFARQFVSEINSSKLFKVNKTVANISQANDKMNKSQIDGTIVLPANFG